MGILIPISLIILSYLLGSIPNALIISKAFKGIDIRDYGSKNMGATNVNRVMGFKYGLLVFFLDAIKAGLIISLFTFKILDYQASYMMIEIHPLVYGLVAIIGHVFPIFAGFKGGKGVSCFAGIICFYAPLIALISFFFFLTVLIVFRYLSLSSILTTLLVFILSWFKHTPDGKLDFIFILLVGIILIFIVIRHSSNIKRIINHTEPKFTIVKSEK